jgi:hypothetical protein
LIEETVVIGVTVILTEEATMGVVSEIESSDVNKLGEGLVDLVSFSFE